MKSSIKEHVIGFLKNNKKAIIKYILWAIFCMIVFLYIFPAAKVTSESMEPTIPCGSRIVADSMIYWIEEPQREDVVVFYSEELRQLLIKRMIGKEGDIILIQNGKVYVNNQELEESYLMEGTVTEAPDLREGFPFIVPENCYFFMGDNRENSLDSRFWENPFVKRSCIRGKLRIVF